MMDQYRLALSRRRRWRGAAGVAVALALGVGTSPALSAAPSVMTATYELSYLGAPVAEARLRLESDGHGPRYLALRLRPRRVGSLVNALSGGALKADYRADLAGDRATGVLPRRLEADDAKREKVYRYTGSGHLAGLDVTPDSHRKRYTVPAPAVLARGPVLHNGPSALAALMAHVGRAGTCETRMPYFDGRRRSDIVGRDAGRDAASEALAAVRDGPLRQCRLQERKPAEAEGFKDKLIVDSDDDALVMALAVVDGHAVPVRAAVQAGAGTARAKLTRFELSVAGDLVAAVP